MREKTAAAVLMFGALVGALAGGVGEYSVDQHVDISGRVFLRGSAPFTYPVIQTRTGVVWVLDGVDPNSIKPLLGKQVEISGAVSRTEQAGSVLPVIDVDAVRVLP